MSQQSSRRKFLLGSAGAVALGAIAFKTHDRWPRALDPLQSIVDTIVPSDETIGALELKLDEKLLAEMQQKPKTKERVERLLAATSKQALSQFQREFNALTLDQREELLSEILASDTQIVFRSDLHVIRRKIMSWFYASREGQASLEYASPVHYPAYAASQPF